jgi:hypothetical protein
MRGNRTARFISLILITALIFSCNALTPAGFWKNFDKDHIVQKENDHGPWGGHSLIYWQNSTCYKEEQILKFAADNGWKLVSANFTNKNITAGHNWIKYPGKIYKFNSGWVIRRSDEDTAAYGYIIISTGRTRMAVYHEWGE